MTGSVAQTIQGEAGSDPAHQFAVASVIYNRMQQGGFGGSSASQIVNAPDQFTGFAATPNSSAQQFAAAIENGTLPQYGNTGNAVYFQQAGSNTTLGSRSPGVVNIGGNNFSDQWGSPSAAFQAPQYAAAGGANFTPPAGTPDQFVVSTTPGSQSEVPINPGDYSSDPNASFDFNDPNVGAGTGAPSGTTGGTGSGTTGTGTQTQSGAGQPVQLNLSPQTASDFASYVNAPITAAENWAKAQFATLENWFGRGFLILLGIVIVMVALWRVSGAPSPAVIAERVGKAA